LVMMSLTTVRVYTGSSFLVSLYQNGKKEKGVSYVLLLFSSYKHEYEPYDFQEG
jgi:Ran GTPase-activating protein (RanGAP) involved in mRNA processing and transport